jgi:hypothetical protein
VVDPDKSTGIPDRDSDNRGRKKAYDDTTAAMIKAADTLVPQEVPPGSGENAVAKGGVPIPRRGGRGFGGNQTADEEKPKVTPAKQDRR